MLSFPNAKINLGLNITGKLPDGYHTIETIFYPIGLKDALEFVENPSDNKTSLVISGCKVSGNLDQNLVLKAYHLLSNDFKLPQLAVYLHKHIPLGAGLGGGSADAAFMLSMLNSNYKLGLSTDELKKYALRLGADCSFFIDNTPSFASGKGEVLNAIKLSLKGYFLVLVKPDVSVETAKAYSLCTPHKPTVSLLDIAEQPLEEWKGCMKNDFEDPIFKIYPAIAEIKNKLYEKGALYASMSGSGSSVFGIFKQQPELSACFSPHFVWQEKLE